jgi:hypothetical protein
MTELKPCPFCGQTPTPHKVEYGMPDKAEYFSVLSGNSNCVCSIWFIYSKLLCAKEEEVIEKWNARAGEK